MDVLLEITGESAYAETNSSVIEYALTTKHHINLCKIDNINFLRCYSVLKIT
jgi:hypothetical protein